jgi:hypothetical protein
MSIKLIDSQLVMMSKAAQREDRCLVAPPTLKSGAAEKVANKLIFSGLVKEIKAKAGTPVWCREAKTGQAYALKLTGEGAKAVAVDKGLAPEAAGDDDGSADHRDPKAGLSSAPVLESPSTEATEPAPVDLAAPRIGSKIMQVVELLKRNRGATLGELIDATGWLAHTTRAALTGLRKRGYEVALNRWDTERGSFYYVKADPSLSDGAPAARLVEKQANSKVTRKPPGRRSRSGARRAA